MKSYKLTVVVWKEKISDKDIAPGFASFRDLLKAKEGKEVYVSKCPELGVSSCGDTPQEAEENLKEAVELYLENAKALGMWVGQGRGLDLP